MCVLLQKNGIILKNQTQVLVLERPSATRCSSSEVKQGDTSTWFSLPLAQRALPTSPLTSILIHAAISLRIFSMVFLTGKKLPTGVGI